MAERKAALRTTGDDLGVVADLEEFLGYNLKRAYIVVQTDFRAMLGKDGLAPRAFSALSFVVTYPNITQSELARRLGIERSGLVAIIDDLEARKYLVRVDVPGDRRVQALVPTTMGAQAYAEARAAVRTHEDRLLSDFSATEKATLIRLLRKIRTRGEVG